MEKLKVKSQKLKKSFTLFSRSDRGFTLIELILYLALVTMMLSILIPFAWTVIGGGAKSTTDQELSSLARIISERMKYKIRNSNQINTPAINASGTTLSLNSGTATLFRLNGTKIQISENGGTNYYDLNSNDTIASGLTFTNYSSADNKTKNIQFQFTLDEANTTGPQNYKSPAITIIGTAELRGN